MHMAIDIAAAITLLFFFLAGLRKGFMVSLLGIIRIVLAYGGAFFAGRYIGFWLGEATHRPKIVTIPIVAAMTFMFIFYFFHIVISGMRNQHREKQEEDENFHHPILSSLAGGTINLGSGTLLLVLLFWMGDLFLVGTTGSAIPGANDAYFSRLARRAIYETSRYIIPGKAGEPQVDAISHMISNPADGMAVLEEVVEAESIQQLVTDQQLAADLLSGEPERIQQNASMQRLFNDRPTLENLRELGVLSGTETRSGLCEKLSAFGRNEKIRASIESLRERDMLRADKILLLIRDPYFDIIVAELLR
ncbi:MAG: CvpA family protein [Verrucomicrobiota bacterium]